MQNFDVIMVGAGAAGLFCAGVAAQRGLRVLVLDHSPHVAEKIRISGGGRCNFTNKEVGHTNFLSQNPHFCRSALHQYTSQDFIGLVRRHGIAFHEKHKGQLFCDHSSEQIIQMLLQECEAGASGGVVQRWQPCAVHAVRYTHSATESTSSVYELDTAAGTVRAPQLVIATGGLSIPKIGATDFGYRIAQQFDVPLIPRKPALVPLSFHADQWQPYASLSGLSLPVTLQVSIPGGKKTRTVAFHEDLLFTHKGLSGPGILQISSYWETGEAIEINLLPQQEVLHELTQAKMQSKRLLVNELAQWMPTRLAQRWVQDTPLWQRPVNEVPDKALAQLAESLKRWRITPQGTLGYQKAEVTAGGIDTRALSSQTLESRQPGLFFIGEVVDVTGWLGGYNFQWAWSSAYACAQALTRE